MASSQTPWDPAALLQPRRVSKPTSANQPDTSENHHVVRNSKTNGVSRKPDVVFQFTSRGGSVGPDDSTTTSQTGTAYNSAASSPQASMAGMLERMKNVQDRSTVPQVKRRRLEEGNDDGKSTPSFAIRGGSGMLSDHIKQATAGSTTASTPISVQAIDLTEDDSQDPVVQDPKDEEVCLGMLTSRLQCHITPSPKPNQQSIFGPTYYPAVKTVLRRQEGDRTNRIMAVDHTRQVIGNVDVQTSKILVPLLDARMQLRSESRIPTVKREADETPGTPTSRLFPLEITLYGRMRYARFIGKHLAQGGLRLVNPNMVERGVKVFNPHMQQGRDTPAKPSAVKTMQNGANGSGASYSHSSVPAIARSVEEVRSVVMGVFDSLTMNDELPEAEAVATIKTPLLKHQKQGLYFMMARERAHNYQTPDEHMSSFWKMRYTASGEKVYLNAITGQTERQPPPDTRGGVLADMMGLGKTLSTLALIMSSLENSLEWAEQSPQQPKEPEPSKLSKSILPTPKALGFTRLARNAKTTLLVCPLSTVTNWEEQIKAHIKPNCLKVHIYHGPSRIKDVDKLSEFDLVITTYGSIASELGALSKGKAGSYPLEQIGWYRIVLDEAHMIREHNTLQFKAIYRLQAERRWAVTGTPVQNRLDDFAALLAFLRLKPFDDRSKFVRHIVEPFKNCDPDIVPKLRVLVDTITLRRLKDKINLPPRTDQVVRLDFSSDERAIYDLFARNAQDRVRALAGPGVEKALGGQTYMHILRSILRLRLICAHGKDLLNDEDLNVLQGMTADMAISIDDDDSDNQGPPLSERQAYEILQLIQEANNDNCIDCGKKLGSHEAEHEGQEDVLGYMNPCFHVICTMCHKSFKNKWKATLREGSSSGPCPVCAVERQFYFVELRRSKADVEHEGAVKGRSKSSGQGKDDMSQYNGPHTKTKALLADLLQSEQESAAKPDEPPYKSVVFSGWTSHLNLIQLSLDSVGIKYTRLDGSMSRTARTHAMDLFRDDPDVHVILVSIMAGGLGLNLTSGNRVYVMEPQFNPAAEAQAIDRVHRLGQTRPVRTVRYIMRDSFEEKMLELQDKKKKLASLSMDTKGMALDKAEAARQKLMDLRSLFK